MCLFVAIGIVLGAVGAVMGNEKLFELGLLLVIGGGMIGMAISRR